MGANKGVDLASLLVSDSSSDSSSEEERSKKKKKKHKSKKSKKSKYKKSTKETDVDSSYEDRKKKLKKNNKKDRKEISSKKLKKQNNYNESQTELDNHRRHKIKDTESNLRYPQKEQRRDSRKRNSDSYDSEIEFKSKKSKRDGNEYHDSSAVEPHKDRRRGVSPEQYKRKSESFDSSKQNKSVGLSEGERAARLAAMAAAGAEREVQRGRRVAEQRAVDAAESAAPRHGVAARSDARALPDSLESRIHSNRHYIQRDKRHMNEHFARR